MNRPNAAALAVSSLAAGFSIGCGAPSAETGATAAADGLQPFQLLIDWQVEPTYLGVYLARERGHFESLGLDVEIVESSGANAAAAAVAAGSYPIGTASGAATVTAVSRGASLVSTAVLYQRLPTVIYGLADQGVDAPADLLMTTPGCSEGRVTPTDVAAPSVSCRVGAAGPAGDRGRSGRPRAPGRPGCAGPSCTGSGTYGRARPAIGRRSGRVAATASAGVPVR